MVDPVTLGSELRALTVKGKGSTASAEPLGKHQYTAQVWMQKTAFLLDVDRCHLFVD